MTFLSEIKPVLSATDGARANRSHDFAIVAESDDFIVVEKPPFLLVHPTKPSTARTLWGELKQLLAFEIANGGQVSIVNRLDRETSGLVLVAKNAAAARRFGLLMQEQRIAKEYLAIVWDWPEWETHSVDAPLARQGAHGPSPIWLKQTSGRIEQPIARDPRNRTRMAVVAGGREALSIYKIRHSYDAFTLLDVELKTGRTHQIRVHLAWLKHPVVGDEVYAGGRDNSIKDVQLRARVRKLSRQFLHAETLAFHHPASGELVRFNAPLPEELQQLLAALEPK